MIYVDDVCLEKIRGKRLFGVLNSDHLGVKLTLEENPTKVLDTKITRVTRMATVVILIFKNFVGFSSRVS